MRTKRPKKIIPDFEAVFTKNAFGKLENSLKFGFNGWKMGWIRRSKNSRKSPRRTRSWRLGPRIGIVIRIEAIGSGLEGRMGIEIGVVGRGVWVSLSTWRRVECPCLSKFCLVLVKTWHFGHICWKKYLGRFWRGKKSFWIERGTQWCRGTEGEWFSALYSQNGSIIL